MLELPDDLTDPLSLADWMELFALSSPDRNSSQGDLESTLRRAALAELSDNEMIERKTLEVFEELEQRVKASGSSYPFTLDYQGVVQVRSGSWKDYPVYVFCLCLSYFGSGETKLAPKLFERIACLAAQSYLQGKAIGFGWPRSELPPSFPEAVSSMCRCIGEGEGYREQDSLDRKDDALDLVAWKDFADKRSSKILMFGQCASGQNWEEKLEELQPQTFWNQWMLVPPVSPFPARSFFIPHRIERGKWDLVSRKAGILFDRCRISFWAQQENADYGPHITWTEDLLIQVIT